MNKKLFVTLVKGCGAAGGDIYTRGVVRGIAVAVLGDDRIVNGPSEYGLWQDSYLEIVCSGEEYQMLIDKLSSILSPDEFEFYHRVIDCVEKAKEV